MTDDDWAPLPEADLTQRPGESADVPVRAKLAPPPPSPPPPDPAAEAALAALQQKLRAAKPATSLVAAAAHAADKAARKQRARANPTLQATLATIADDPTQRPQLAYEAGVDGRDEREESDWFRALPEEERERLRKAWTGKRVRAADSSVGQRRVANRRMVACLVAFALVVVLGSHMFWHATIGAGVVCAIWWRYAPPDRFMDPVRAIVCQFGLHGVAMFAQGATNPAMFMDAVLLVAFAGIVGFDGEIRRTGGFDAQ